MRNELLPRSRRKIGYDPPWVDGAGEQYMRRFATAATILSIATLVPITAFASDLVWEVQSPFRFFKKQTSFATQEKAFEAVRGKADAPLPANIVWRTERRLNDPDCTDK